MKKNLAHRAIATAFFLAVALTVPGVAARASGTAVVQQRDGSTKTYRNVFIRVNNDAMALTSSDRQGMLIIGKAACTHIGELVRCLPYDATLDQHGKSYHIVLQSGTVWLNPTMTAQPLSYSSAQLQPHGVLMSIHTKAGTFVSLTGTVDEIQK
jgi:hypothetical protein